MADITSDNITLITYGGSLVTPQHDALMADAELTGNGTLYGCEVSGSQNTLHITHGVGVIYGREFEITEHDITVDSPQSGSLLGQVFIRLNLSAPSPISIKVVTEQSLTVLEDNADINTQTTHTTEMQLATFSIDTSGISSASVRQTAPQITRVPELKSGLASLTARVTNLEKDSGWKTIGQYITYRIINNIVYLRVRQSGGDMRRNGYVFGTLPSGVYPVFSFAEANVYGVGRVFINQNHTVTFETSSESESANYIQGTFVYPLG